MMSLKIVRRGLASAVVLAALASAGAMEVTEDVVLDANTDWREHGTVTIPQGVTVDLNGYSLKVKGLVCNGRIIDRLGAGDYRQLTYIESSQAQWIDTGFVPGEATAIDMDFSTLNENDNRAFFCATWGSDGTMLVVNQGQFRFFGNGGNLAAWSPNHHYRFVTTPGEDTNVVLYDGETGTQLGGLNKSLKNQNNYTMTLFGGNNNGTRFQFSTFRLYAFKMTDDGTVVRDLLPVERVADGKPGLYDRANAVFYDNDGTGEFIKGEVATRLFLDLSDGAPYSIDGTCEVPMAVADCELAQDCDLRALGPVKFEGTVALNGHKLLVAGTTGNGSIVNLSGSGLFSHYRFKVEAIGSGNCLGFSDLRLFSFGANVTGLRGGASCSSGGGASGANETYLAALDGSVDNKWCVGGINNFNTLWIQVDYAEPIAITKYEWWSTNDGAQRDRAPTKWRFQGSNDGTTWTDIDVVQRAYGDNPATSKTLAYTYDTGITSQPATGEFHIDVPEGETVENTLLLEGDVRLVKDGDGALVETRASQRHGGGDEIAAGTLLYAAQNYVVPGNLTLSGGTLVVADGNPLAVGGVFSVTAPSVLLFLGEAPVGNELLVAHAGTEFELADLTLLVEPEIADAGILRVENGDLTAFFGGADDVAVAYWTGALDGDVSKSGNWRCLNGFGIELSDRLPDEPTTVHISGDVNIQIPVGAVLPHRNLIFGACRLTADCDWRGLDDPIDAPIGLNGHKLHVSSLSGSGAIREDFTGGYKFYRFKIEAIGSGNILGFSDLRLFRAGADVTNMRSNASGNNGGGSSSGAETYQSVLDGSVDNKWCSVYINNFDNLWVQVEYAEPMPITRYEWWSTNDGAQRERAPTKWRFQGSNDGTTWTDLDVVERAYGDNPATSKTLAYRKVLKPELPTPAELHVEVPADETRANTSIEISGNVKVVKDGEGTFVAGKADQAYLGGTLAAAGTLRPGANANGVFGAEGTTLAVAAGAQLLDPLAANLAVEGLWLELAGTGFDGTGAYRVTTFKGYAYNYAWTAGLTLTDDTLFGRDDYGFGLIAFNYGVLPLKLNGHTLTYRSPKAPGQQNATHLAIANVQGEGPGTLVISDNVKLYPMKDKESVLPEVTLVIEPLAEYWTGNDAAGQNLTVSNLVYRSTSANSQTAHATTVLGCYAPASTISAPKVQLGDAEHLKTTLDLGEMDTAFDANLGGGLTFAEGSTVKVVVGARRVSQMEWLVTWSGKPENVTFVSGQKNGCLQVGEEGIRFLSGLTIIVR